MRKRIVLVVVGHYLPGFKAGGPVRTLVNLVSWLGDEFDFRILTRDRDLGDRQPFHDIVAGTWREWGGAWVMHLSPSQLNPFAWAKLLSRLDYDVLYLNSFFDTLSVQSVIVRRLGLVQRRPVVLAPRGEFSQGALSLKAPKKRLYIALATAISLYQGVRWQASSELEARDILRALAPGAANSEAIRIVPNLPSRLTANGEAPRHPAKVAGRAQVVFIARIARMKNLAFALRVLSQAQGELDFNIYGPDEDAAYWQECQALIQQLPANVRTRYHGPIPSHHIPGVLAEAHLFFLPTLGENFGHAIFEALSAGCPVLISDRTPWRDLARHNAGWDVSPERPDEFTSRLNALVAMPQEAWERWSDGARQLALAYSGRSANLEANRRLFTETTGSP